MQSRPSVPCSALAKAITRPRRSFSLTQARTSHQQKDARASTPVKFVPPHLPSSAGSKAARISDASTVQIKQKLPQKAASSHPVQVSHIPLHLPDPPIVRISDPHVDLKQHLVRHGMYGDVKALSAAEGITADYLLEKWVLTASQSGPESLLNESSTFLNENRCGDLIREQLLHAQQVDGGMPTQFTVPMNRLSALSAEAILPDRMLAIYGRESDEKGFMVPAHSMLYILQCVTLPSFASFSPGHDEDKINFTLHVVPVCVPAPKLFGVVHRFVYTHSLTSLLEELLPMRFLARYCKTFYSNTGFDFTTDCLSGFDRLTSHGRAEVVNPVNIMDQNSATQTKTPATALPVQAVAALSQLASSSLLQIAFKIRSVYANGVAIGLLENSFWRLLKRVWSLIVAALGVKRCRTLEAGAAHH